MNKPFDRILKDFADEAPEIFLRLLGIIPADADVEITPLRPETAPTVIMPDFVALLAVDRGRPFILHVEFLLSYHTDVPSTMARYGGSLAWQYRRPVKSILVLLRPRGVPKIVPEVGDFVIGVTCTTHPFRVVRLWEIDPRPLLERHDWRLLPWSVLMKSSDEEVRRIAEILARDGDEESVGRFLTLGSIRYDRSHLEEMLGASKMGLVEAILEGSSLVKEVADKAAEKAAMAEGRRLLRMILNAKFPGLDSPDIDTIAATETLESLITTASTSTDRPSMEQALTAAARVN